MHLLEIDKNQMSKEFLPAMRISSKSRSWLADKIEDTLFDSGMGEDRRKTASLVTVALIEDRFRLFTISDCGFNVEEDVLSVVISCKYGKVTCLFRIDDGIVHPYMDVYAH